jgi:hypothetical protein
MRKLAALPSSPSRRSCSCSRSRCGVAAAVTQLPICLLAGGAEKQRTVFVLPSEEKAQEMERMEKQRKVVLQLDPTKDYHIIWPTSEEQEQVAAARLAGACLCECALTIALH